MRATMRPVVRPAVSGVRDDLRLAAQRRRAGSAAVIAVCGRSCLCMRASVRASLSQGDLRYNASPLRLTALGQLSQSPPGGFSSNQMLRARSSDSWIVACALQVFLAGGFVPECTADMLGDGMGDGSKQLLCARSIEPWYLACAVGACRPMCLWGRHVVVSRHRPGRVHLISASAGASGD
jgi:hypothetical protein